MLQVEWLGAEDAKQKVRGSSAGGCEAREKSRDLWLATRDRGASLGIKKIPIFSAFFGFPRHCRFHISVGL